MCAGNSPEEALVQGLSEIIERVVQRRIFTEKPALPDVPEEYIQQFPYVYEIIQKLKEQEKAIIILSRIVRLVVSIQLQH